MRPEDRERIQVEVVSRVVEQHVAASGNASEGYLETLVNDTIYNERRRLEKASSERARAEAPFYDEILRRMQHASERDLRKLTEKLARRFVGEVVGNFDKRVYSAATGAIPAGLWALLNAMSPSRLFSLEGFKRGLADHLELWGEVDHLKSVAEKGTLVFVPTHSSNLDSILLGYAIYLMGLPPVTYGAGINLFTNPLISFFMANLGAYKVDRKKTSTLYKEVLKEYATCSMEMGYNNLFFPGGTRSRSGKVERKLKKGLLGCAIRAYINNLREKAPRPNLYIVPMTINYLLVLEAETLIDDHLKEVGKSRYIITDDEFSRPREIYNFMNNLISMDSRIVLTCSAPMDVFGNRVDREGRSVDGRGRIVDPSRYVTRESEPVFDDQRDYQYTREVSDEIAGAYLADNVIHSTHITGHALFRLLKSSNPGVTLYRLLRTGGEHPSFTMTQVHQEVDRLLRAFEEMEPRPRLGPVVQEGDVQEIVNDALRAFSVYHTRRAAVRRGDRMFHEDRNLLLFYSNRLEGYELERHLNGGGM